MHDKFYYIVGVSLVVLLVLVVYVGSRVQNMELGLVNVDSRLSSVERALGVVNSTSYDSASADDQYTASAYDALDALSGSSDSYEYPFDDTAAIDSGYDYTSAYDYTTP